MKRKKSGVAGVQELQNTDSLDAVANVRGASRRDNTDRSLARSAWEGVPRKNRPVGYGMIRRS
jgi:hypothetical protein